MDNIETNLVHTGKEHNTSASVTPPIYQTSTYHAPADSEQYAEAGTAVSSPHFYHRHGNPVSNQVSAIIASLEGTEAALMTSSGMAAISTAVFAVVKAGDHIIVQYSHYSAASMFFRDFLPALGFDVTFVHQEINEEFEQAIKPNTRLIYIETPSNPVLTLTDMAFVAALAKKHGITTICDNTFASPLNQQPHKSGIDIVIHSATKYMGGHSDLTAGVICSDKERIKQAWKTMITLGTSLSSFDSWLLLRGLRTLSLRVNQINNNALALATFLEQHAAIKKVLYCGLPSHPQYELAKRQMTGFTGMICVDVAGKDDAAQFKNAQSVLKRLRLFANAASLGGVESLAVQPITMWGRNHTAEQKQALGITDGLIRISVGIENSEDLINDFKQALDAVIV